MPPGVSLIPRNVLGVDLLNKKTGIVGVVVYWHLLTVTISDSLVVHVPNVLLLKKQCKHTRISTWGFGFHSSLKTIMLSKFQKQPGHHGRLTHPQRSSLLQYRWSIVCWISIIWIDVMVVSIPVVKRNSERKWTLCIGEVLCSCSDPRRTFNPHPNGKRRKKSGQGFCFCLGEWVVIAKFKSLLIKSQALETARFTSKKHFWAIEVLLNWNLLEMGDEMRRAICFGKWKMN